MREREREAGQVGEGEIGGGDKGKGEGLHRDRKMRKGRKRQTGVTGLDEDGGRGVGRVEAHKKFNNHKFYNTSGASVRRALMGMAGGAAASRRQLVLNFDGHLSHIEA